MKVFTLFILVLLFIMLTGTQSAQNRCLTCPSITDRSTNHIKGDSSPVRDSVYRRLALILAKQDSLVKAVENIKIRDTVVRREYYRLLTGEWFYYWHYVDGNFVKLIKKRI